jgi:hypothetical protein
MGKSRKPLPKELAMRRKFPWILSLLIFAETAQASWTGKILACAAHLLGEEARQQWLVSQQLAPRLPLNYPMAYAVNHRYRYFGVPHTLFSSIPHRGSRETQAFDFAKLDFNDAVPTRFIVGEGENYRALIGVDLTPGSPLYIEVERIRKVIAWSGAKTPEEILQKVAQNIGNQVGPVFRTNQELLAGPALPWDKQPVPGRSSQIDLRQYPIDHAPIPGRFSLPVIPLEKMVARAEAYCMGQALLAWIVLRSYDIGCRPLFGANWVRDNQIVGHSSVELADGRIVDPAGWVIIPTPALGSPGPSGIDEKWRFLTNYLTYPNESAVGLPTWRFRYERFLGIVLEDERR